MAEEEYEAGATDGLRSDQLVFEGVVWPRDNEQDERDDFANFVYDFERINQGGRYRVTFEPIPDEADNKCKN